MFTLYIPSPPKTHLQPFISMEHKQQGDEIGAASAEQENSDCPDQLTPDMDFISSLKISDNTQGTLAETPKAAPQPVSKEYSVSSKIKLVRFRKK